MADELQARKDEALEALFTLETNSRVSIGSFTMQGSNQGVGLHFEPYAGRLQFHPATLIFG